MDHPAASRPQTNFTEPEWCSQIDRTLTIHRAGSSSNDSAPNLIWNAQTVFLVAARFITPACRKWEHNIVYVGGFASAILEGQTRNYDCKEIEVLVLDKDVQGAMDACIDANSHVDHKTGPLMIPHSELVLNSKSKVRRLRYVNKEIQGFVVVSFISWQDVFPGEPIDISSQTKPVGNALVLNEQLHLTYCLRRHTFVEKILSAPEGPAINGHGQMHPAVSEYLKNKADEMKGCIKAMCIALRKVGDTSIIRRVHESADTEERMLLSKCESEAS